MGYPFNELLRAILAILLCLDTVIEILTRKEIPLVRNLTRLKLFQHRHIQCLTLKKHTPPHYVWSRT